MSYLCAPLFSHSIDKSRNVLEPLNLLLIGFQLNYFKIILKKNKKKNKNTVAVRAHVRLEGKA